ncbi:MFS transporter [Curtobacterium ammoniigenes]|uniref:MFS transporter n=1 Tax=Curtobacterium ammoniigenes TaxID=395387 RepID=UPI00082F0E21|nr:MFS transporter [Curtobacterium ammoniigenes]
MPPLSPGRRRLALLALALGGFAIGTTEFVAMGLLPNIAAALLHTQYAADPQAGIAHAGWLVSAYALGVVVGAPTIAATSARLPRKRLLLMLLVAFTLATVASAVLPTFGLVLVARFVAGLPHGAYFGVASIVAAEIMGPGSRGKGVAMVLAGLTIANVVGVPGVTWVGQHASWRLAYLLVAALFALTFFAVLALVPHRPAPEGASIRRELQAFGRTQVWIVMGLGAIGFGGFFAVYSYISPLVVHVAGLSAASVPLVLVAVGVGMTIGNVTGGILADRDVRQTIFLGLGALMVSLILVVVLAPTGIGIFIAAFVLGLTSSMIGPAVQSRLMDVAGHAHTIGAALNHSAFNLGNSLGAFLGGAAIAAGLGYRSPAVIGVGLAVLGVGIAVVSYTVERRSRAAVQRTSTTGSITAPVPTV